MDLMDLQAVDHIKSKLQDVTVTPIPMRRSSPYDQTYTQSNSTSQSQMSPLILTSYQSSNTNNLPSPLSTPTNPLFSLNSSSSLSKYAQLLLVIEEMGRDLRPTYTGSRSSAERLKRGILNAKYLVRECLMETERSARQ